MREAKLHFESDAEIETYVAACEARFACQLEAAGRYAVEHGQDILTLCGPTCSGKTTAAALLSKTFANMGRRLHVISIDNFYYSREYLRLRSLRHGTDIDYDSPDTIDIDCFASAVRAIAGRGRVELPVYDFKEGRRVSALQIECTAEDAFLFEGIQAVYPALTKYLAPHGCCSLFISVEQPLLAGTTVFDPREIRLLRRLVRDFKFRNANAQFTFSLWRSVCKNEDEHIYPNLSGCHFRIDSLMPYEIQVIKPYVLSVLSELGAESEYRAEAEQILHKLSTIESISQRFVPADSVFREFIG